MLGTPGALPTAAAEEQWTFGVKNEARASVLPIRGSTAEKRKTEIRLSPVSEPLLSWRR